MAFTGSFGEILADVSMGFPIKGKVAKSKLNKLNNWYKGQKSMPAGQKGNPGISKIPKVNNPSIPKPKTSVDGRFGGGKKSGKKKAK